MTRVALYLRTSHAERTVENQRMALLDVAGKRGWQIVVTFVDEAISGAKGRDKRPGLRKLMEGAIRRDFDMVCAWSVDRLGRSISDLIATLQDLNKCGCELYLHQQALDTGTPSGRAMFQMLGVFAEFERSMIQARIKAGLARRVAQGKKLGRQRKPKEEAAHQAALAKAFALWDEGCRSYRRIERETGINSRTFRRALDARTPAFLD